MPSVFAAIHSEPTLEVSLTQSSDLPQLRSTLLIGKVIKKLDCLYLIVSHQMGRVLFIPEFSFLLK